MTTRELWADDEVDEAPPQLDDYPTLGEAAKAPAQSKAQQAKKKNKPAKMSLAEMMNVLPTGGRSMPMGRGTDKEILAHLPTSSRGKVEGEEDTGKLGGGFTGYGGDRGGGGGGFRREEGGRGGPRGNREDGEGFMPSRADTVDDWGSTRQFQPSGPDSRGPRGPPRGDREPRQYSSAADDVDDWGSSRKYEPSNDDRGGARGGFGGAGGFKDAPPRRGGMFESRPISRADEEDQWARGREFQQGERPVPRERSGSRNFGFGGDARGPAGEDRWSKKAPEPAAEVASPESAPAERPRLKLAPRTLPVEKPAAAAAEEAPAATVAAAPAPEEDKPKAKPREEAGSWRKPLPEVAASQAATESDATPAAEPPAAAAPSQSQPEVAPAVPAIILETPAERELQAAVAKLRARLDELTEDADVDPDDVAEARAELEAEERKLAAATAEREEMERRAAAAAASGEAEDDGSWVPASKGSKPAPAKEAAPRAAGGERTSPGGRGGAAGGRRSDRRDGESAGFGGKPGEGGGRSGPRPVAAGAPGLERKW